MDRLRGLLIVLEHEYGKLSVPRPHKAGDAWDDWVRELTAICDKSGLYIEARQDDKAETNPSEFVALIEKLQTFLLPPLRRHTHSRTALAGAINRAREVRNA